MLNEISKYFVQYKDIYGSELYINNDSLNKIKSADEKNLFEYFNSIKNCFDCSLGHTRKKFVFGEGNPNADIVFIGEAPGEKEDFLGRPFVGKSGQLLDKILLAINLKREDVYILNIIKCRPPNNRNPLSEEIEKCVVYSLCNLSGFHAQLSLQRVLISRRLLAAQRMHPMGRGVVVLSGR